MSMKTTESSLQVKPTMIPEGRQLDGSPGWPDHWERQHIGSGKKKG